MNIKHQIVKTSIVLFLFSLFTPALVKAVSITTSSTQASLNASDEYVVNVNVAASVANSTKYYLRGEFFKPATTNYCGYTWNGTSYFNGPYGNQGFINLLPITITNGTWSGQLKAKIDTSSSVCNAPGTYSFRVLRYTEGGTSSDDEQIPLSVSVIFTETPLPSETPSSTPSATPTPTDTPSPTSTASATPTATPTTTPQETATATPTAMPTPTETASASPSPTPQPSVTASPKPSASPTEKPDEHNHWDEHWRFTRFSDFHFGRYHCRIEYVKIWHRWFITFAPQLVCSRR